MPNHQPFTIPHPPLPPPDCCVSILWLVDHTDLTGEQYLNASRNTKDQRMTMPLLEEIPVIPDASDQESPALNILLALQQVSGPVHCNEPHKY